MERNRQHTTDATELDCKQHAKRWIDYVGLACIALGELIVCIGIWVRGDVEFTSTQATVAALAALGMAVIGAGVGWQCREESGWEDGRRGAGNAAD